ncbi:DUF389 domain-containing protein [Oerskovia sp. KBS0722]|uniref:DUF389 domain-containing protein n=1 Tax=Oerskovia sp. KBS0722 TaxID=1179673 RepID=UPI00110D3F80|nr:DUF389 domain-containing protein [Oerskovia sp. KBS0722]QDW64265.1 DUF389 domain-containing protein [Oerskovia sp. KBS0722]
MVWEQIDDQARNDARPSWSFFVFLDQPILIIGAMVVGPEFAPIAAACVALARRRPRLLWLATSTLLGGFFLAGVVCRLVWVIAYAAGAITFAGATSGVATEVIVKPDAWSFVIALLAGCAGVLTLAVGAWDEARASLVQLGVNLAGLVVSGTSTLLVQQLVWRHPGQGAGRTDRSARQGPVKGH